HNRAFEVTEADRSTKFAGFGFDASVWEVFPYLIAGASLYVIHDEIRLNVRELNAYYERNGITISFLPTQFCEQFMELDNRSLRVLLTGGDKLKTYRKRNYRLVNNYGPTENTVVATSSPVEKLEWNLPIGRPIDNVRAYIVGRTGGLQPIGVPGELCLAGDGLAQGYLNREELTAEKFIDNPFEAGGRMYRTGDLAKWLEDGNIAYMGRIDSQIKIRGYRIEPGEIAQRLLEHDAVDEAAVVAKEQAGGEKQLVAYIAARQEWSAAELRNWLAQTLPDYMIPRHMVAIERMPVTANGKINELALPEPNDMPAASYKAPATLTECKLAAIWEDVLGVQNVGIFDNFFERGGHSLKATQAVSRINEEMGISLSLREFFEAPTVHGQSRFLDAAAVNKFEQIQPLEKRELYPATSYQAYTYKVAMNNTAYNIPQMLLIKGELDVERLSNCFRQMIARHEVLRTSFEKVKGELMMRIHDGVPFALNVEPAREEELPRLANAHIRPFDLGQAPLLHVKLLQVEEQKHLLMFDMHHILSDGTSFTVFFNELMTLYAGKAELPEIRIHYKDYVAWKFDQIQDGHLKREEDYWINKLSGELPVLHVPTDYPRPETHQMVGTQYKFEIGEQLTQRLRQYSLQQNTTLYMTLLAAYNAFLMKYSGGQEDIIVGTWAAARTSQELERMIGLFINSIPLRNYPKPDKTYCQLLKEVKVTLLEAYDHQNYPFELLVDKLNAPQDPSRSAIYDTAFSFLNIELPDIQAEGLSITGYPFDWKVAEYDFYLAAAEGEHTLSMELAYSTLLFKEDTIVTMAGDFVAVLQQVMDDPELELGQLGLPGLQSCASTLTGLQA
ncbi:condensation domain-containing protein, partial [Paenibacillus algorifonticola]|uniref:condensation domain-containing protein n=1 Tax=Paenibacillus algorifonticola TaxID=684063 RepID=UPI003D29CA6E